MAKLFFDHLIIFEELVAVLDSHKLTPQERRQLIELMDQTLHQEILATILKLLPKEHHEPFLVRFHATPDDRRILEFLHEKSGISIEKAILTTAEKVKRKIQQDIKNSLR